MKLIHPKDADPKGFPRDWIDGVKAAPMNKYERYEALVGIDATGINIERWYLWELDFNSLIDDQLFIEIVNDYFDNIGDCHEP